MQDNLTEVEGWAWCLHCERAMDSEPMKCPFSGCDGGPFDIWEGVVPHLKGKPVHGQRYPLYPPKEIRKGEAG